MLAARAPVPPKYTIDWFVDSDGDAPVHRWLVETLSDEARELVGAALLEVLQAEGPGVCGTRFGRQLGGGVFEFRLDGDPQPWIDEARKRRGKGPKTSGAKGAQVQYRIFCHPHGDKLLLLLGAYDKGQDVAKKRQQEEIKVARARLKNWEQRQRVEAKAAKRATAPRAKK